MFFEIPGISGERKRLHDKSLEFIGFRDNDSQKRAPHDMHGKSEIKNKNKLQHESKAR